MSQNYNENLLRGAATLAAGIIKTLSSALTPRRKTWPEKAKDAASELASNTADFAQNAAGRLNKKLILSTVAGGLIGVTTALLLAPKAGNELFESFYKPSKAIPRRAKKEATKIAKKVTGKASHHANQHTRANGADHKHTGRHSADPVVKKVKRAATKTAKTVKSATDKNVKAVNDVTEQS